MEWVEFLKVLGPMDGVMAVAIVMVWKEWRKAEAKTIELLQDQLKLAGDAAAKYSSFEGAIRSLTEVIKEK